MNRYFSIRPFVFEDYPRAVAFWSGIEGLKLNESDTPGAIDAFLKRNPGFSAIAENASGEIVGTVLCGHNGRTGSLHHLAVAPMLRGRGLGKKLVDYCFARLAEARIPRCNIFVYTDNDLGNSFWLRSGWNDPKDWKVLQKIL